MIIIKKIDQKSWANFSAIIYAFIGLATFLSLSIGVMIDLFRTQEYSGSFVWIILANLVSGLVGGLITAFVMAVIGWLIGYLTAIIYNRFCRFIGYVKVDLEEE